MKAARSGLKRRFPRRRRLHRAWALTALAGALCTLAVPGRPSAAAELRLRPTCSPAGPIVTLGDVAEIIAADASEASRLHYGIVRRAVAGPDALPLGARAPGPVDPARVRLAGAPLFGRGAGGDFGRVADRDVAAFAAGRAPRRAPRGRRDRRTPRVVRSIQPGSPGGMLARPVPSAPRGRADDGGARRGRGAPLGRTATVHHYAGNAPGADDAVARGRGSPTAGGRRGRPFDRPRPGRASRRRRRRAARFGCGADRRLRLDRGGRRPGNDACRPAA